MLSWRQESQRVSVIQMGLVCNKNCGRHQNQSMSPWKHDKDKGCISQKVISSGVSSFTGRKRRTRCQCPLCRHRHKLKGRNQNCKAFGFRIILIWWVASICTGSPAATDRLSQNRKIHISTARHAIQTMARP